MRYPWQLGRLIYLTSIMGRDWHKGTLPGHWLFNSWNQSIFFQFLKLFVKGFIWDWETSEVVCTVVQWQQQQKYGFGKVASLTTFRHHWLSCQIKSPLDNATSQVKPSDIYNVTYFGGQIFFGRHCQQIFVWLPWYANILARFVNFQ